MPRLFVEIKPKAAPRPRVTKFGTYNPKDYTQYKKVISTIAKQKLIPTEHPVQMRIDFFFQIPKSWSKHKKENIPPHTSRPDVDNLLKGVKDALNGIAYNDDSQVVSVFARKQYASKDGILIDIEYIIN